MLFLVTLTFGVMSYNRGMKADVNGDHYIYWKAGKDFLSGQKIYTPGLVDGGFTYPPFAAFCFSLFALLPFHSSAFIFTFLINWGLWLPSFLLVRKVMQLEFPNQDLKWPLLIAAALSAGFYWHNYIWMNANLPVFCLTLLGILAFQTGHYRRSYLFLWAATFLKVTPILFLFFFAIKRGPRDWVWIAICSLPFILLPFMIRGYEAGTADWQEYIAAFMAPFADGKIDENIISLGIPAVLRKLVSGNPAAGIAPVFLLEADLLQTVVHILQLASMALLTCKFLYDRYVKDRQRFSAADLCLIFLVPLLLPGRVWAHHHVVTAFIYTYLCYVLIRQQRMALLSVLILLAMFSNLITSDVIGQQATDLLKHAGYVTWLMIGACLLVVMTGYQRHDRTGYTSSS
ncbi:hypothetical protein GCM10023313_11750 [Mucilaginibacter defluvii]|uniref:DUF2029 domain-containing protein n=2 Tax=Mucilaginibacter defluvii TaxID=1196019 RepID=A0ABP9FXF6_9SPHI